MPSLILRGLPDALVQAVKAFAAARKMGVRDGAITLLQYGLKITEDRTKGAEAVNASMTPEARAGRMQALAVKRWRGRYCGPCDRWWPASARECPACGADTDKAD